MVDFWYGYRGYDDDGIIIITKARIFITFITVLY